MPKHDQSHSVVVFPFLKTQGEVSIGGLTFRSTDVTEGLPAEQAASVSEIADMLFLKDNLRIRSASYAIVPFVDLNHQPHDVGALANLQAFVAYGYCLPRFEFGDIFLTPEHASMVLLTPCRVSMFALSPGTHVTEIGPAGAPIADERNEVEGYAGLYGLRHWFCAVKGSRLYPPRPQFTLNDAQDMSYDIESMTKARIDYRLLSELLCKPASQVASRVFTALRWFNAANNEEDDDSAAIVELSIAFEALLRLPREQKTKHFTEAVSLLLGRTPRLDVWAEQFYEARSQVVHEGSTQKLRFLATDKQKGPAYQSLLVYGRQVFQLCLGTVLSGAELAEKAGLQEKFVTNQERFGEICKLLGDAAIPARERLEKIEPIVFRCRKYMYVCEDGLEPGTMLAAVRHTAETLLACELGCSQELQERLERFISAKKDKDHMGELEALEALNDILESRSARVEIAGAQVVRDLVGLVWGYVFSRYYWTKKRQSGQT